MFNFVKRKEQEEKEQENKRRRKKEKKKKEKGSKHTGWFIGPFQMFLKRFRMVSKAFNGFHTSVLFVLKCLLTSF